MGIIPDKIENLLKEGLKKGKIVCLTGAGVSSDSGIPVFRGKGGLWEKYNPQIYASSKRLASVFNSSPEKTADFIIDFYSLFFEAKPNKAHLSLALLEKEGFLSSVITQNVDNLHQQAGSRNLIELHGNVFKIRCPDCRSSVKIEKDRMKEMIELVKSNRLSRTGLLKVFNRYFPRCVCGGRYRTDVVLFGDMLPSEELMRAYEQLGGCGVLLVAGTSLSVYPAAGLPVYAKKKGAKLIEINSESGEFSDLSDCKILGRAAEVLPEILTRIVH